VWTALSSLAAATERIVAMPLGLDVGFRHPAMLARMAASLDQLTGGSRLVLGLGYGGNPEAHRAYGLPWETRVSGRVAHLEEYVSIVRGLWSDPQVTHSGRWYQLENAAGQPTATPPGGPPILVASRGRRYGLPPGTVSDVGVGWRRVAVEGRGVRLVAAAGRRCAEGGKMGKGQG